MGSVASAVETADTIFINGNVYTVNEKQPHAEAIAVSGDRIAFVGSNADAQKLRSDKTRIIDLAGKTVTPGFTDSHCHIFGIGEREMTLNLEGTNTLEDFLQKMKERVAKTEPANGSPAAAGSRLSGNRRSFPPGLISTRSRPTIRPF
jgi:predicted amidohydrolase YtcJ